MADESAFIDTNIFIYALSKDDPRSPIAEAIIASGGTISVQVLNEFASAARRKLKLPWASIADLTATMQRLCLSCRPITFDTHRAATALAARYQFALYDALIVASALEAGCSTLMTEDMHHGLVVDHRLVIHNPFRPPPPG